MFWMCTNLTAKNYLLEGGILKGKALVLNRQNFIVHLQTRKVLDT